MSKVTITENKFCTIQIDEELELYEQVWHPASEEMEENEYKEIHSSMVTYIKDNYSQAPLYWLLDNRSNNYSISPELQEWHAQNVFGQLAQILQHPERLKIAFLVSEDFITQLSNEQTIEEHKETEKGTRYFTEEQEAREWLYGIT